MIASIRHFLTHTLGIDKAISAVLVGRGWSVVSGPVTVLMVANFLSPVEQGYFYTFSSILALQIFFDLGLAFVIMQFASHEKAALEWNSKGLLEGDLKAKQRLAYLFKWSLSWYTIAGVLAFLALWFAGFWFFQTSDVSEAQNIQWQIPWIILLGSTAASLVITPIWGILEGCGKIAEMHWFSSIQNVISGITLWGILASGGHLFAASISTLVIPVMGITWLMLRYRVFLVDLWRSPCAFENRISWRHELWPMQWKISLSWASGYFIFQLISPILFRYHGAEVAGQFGMTQRIATSIQGLAYAWVSTKAATFGSLIAARKYPELMAAFDHSSRVTLAVAAIGSAVFLLGLFLVSSLGLQLANRFLSIPLASLVCLNVFLNCYVFSIAVLARAQKMEPFLVLSLVTAALTSLLVWIVCVTYGATAFLIGINLINLGIAVPVSFIILKRLRRKFV